MTERTSPRQELILTLDAAWRLITESSDPPAVRLAMMRGLIDHSRALALRVGETSRVRAPKSEPPETALIEARNDPEREIQERP